MCNRCQRNSPRCRSQCRAFAAMHHHGAAVAVGIGPHDCTCQIGGHAARAHDSGGSAPSSTQVTRARISGFTIWHILSEPQPRPAPTRNALEPTSGRPDQDGFSVCFSKTCLRLRARHARLASAKNDPPSAGAAAIEHRPHLSQRGFGHRPAPVRALYRATMSSIGRVQTPVSSPGKRQRLSTQLRTSADRRVWGLRR